MFSVGVLLRFQLTTEFSGSSFPSIISPQAPRWKSSKPAAVPLADRHSLGNYETELFISLNYSITSLCFLDPPKSESFIGPSARILAGVPRRYYEYYGYEYYGISYPDLELSDGLKNFAFCCSKLLMRHDSPFTLCVLKNILQIYLNKYY